MGEQRVEVDQGCPRTVLGPQPTPSGERIADVVRIHACTRKASFQGFLHRQSLEIYPRTKAVTVLRAQPQDALVVGGRHPESCARAVVQIRKLWSENGRGGGI